MQKENALAAAGIAGVLSGRAKAFSIISSSKKVLDMIKFY